MAMASHIGRIAKSLILLASGGLFLLLIWVALMMNRGVQISPSPDGGFVKLEGYAFKAGTVRYELPNRPIARAVARVLPDAVETRISWLRAGTTVFVSAPFPNEPSLSAAFSAQDASGNAKRMGTRLAVLDDRNQFFDPGINFLGNGGVFEAVAFPRRGERLVLRLMDGEELVAEFRIPNPSPGPHPVWEAESTPIVIADNELEIALTRFIADATNRTTRCVFRVRENGQESTAWLPAAFELSDASGNHWRPSVKRPVPLTDGQIMAEFLGALWPGESAWKLNVEFRPADEQLEDQRVHTVGFVARPDQLGVE